MGDEDEFPYMKNTECWIRYSFSNDNQLINSNNYVYQKYFLFLDLLLIIKALLTGPKLTKKFLTIKY